MRIVARIALCSLAASLLQMPIADAQAGTPLILSRQQWGADESLLIDGDITIKPDAVAPEPEQTASVPSVRQQECDDAYKRFPDEFKASAPVMRNAAGEKLRWPQQYSSSVRLLVVHHTAIAVTGDPRPGIERMRALYAYHAKNRGWGDIGYHYVIDEQGQVYEGRAGGDSVVGGHVYCNNVGTVGVALMGNFDIEQPTQIQAKSLQKLLVLLAGKYQINLQRNVIFHGKRLSPVVGHGELISTDCPGEQFRGVMDQVRAHVKSNDTDAAVQFPAFLTARSSSASSVNASPTDEDGIATGADGLAALGSLVVEGRPGGELILPIYFRAETKNYTRNTRIARVMRPAELQLWQERDGEYVPVRGDLRIPVPLVKKGTSVVLRLKVRLPLKRGELKMKIGSLQYIFTMEGRSARTTQLLHSPIAPGVLIPAPTVRPTRSSSTSSSSVLFSPSLPVVGSKIRIALDTVLRGIKNADIAVSAGGSAKVNGTELSGTRIRLRAVGGECSAEEGSTLITADAIRIEPANGIVTLEIEQRRLRYRGVIECRVIDGKLVLINELPLEDYMAGIAEEPDTEPYEKQRAFAVAARTYALYYTDPAHRKFAGKPYDGSDDPAVFQTYSGLHYEERTPEWVRAVKDTAGKVLTYNGEIIKPPYFSSDDGRTRSPAEAGWTNFPFAEIYASKPDPWCSTFRLSGHGVGMSGCGAEGQVRDGKNAEQILEYYYPGTVITTR